MSDLRQILIHSVRERDWTKLAALDIGWSRFIHLLLEQINRKEHRFPPWIAHFLKYWQSAQASISDHITLFYFCPPSPYSPA